MQRSEGTSLHQHGPEVHVFVVDLLEQICDERVKRVHSQAHEGAAPLPASCFPIVMVCRCVAGWRQRSPLLGGSSWHMCQWRSLMEMLFCMCLCLKQKGVPGFITDMQKACRDYSSFCQKKWVQLTGKWLPFTGFGCFFFFFFLF